MTEHEQALRELVDGAQDARELLDEPIVPARRPYPTHALPEPFRAYVEAAAHALQVPAEMIALPLLAGTAAAIGTTRALRLTRGARPWRAWPIVWALVVARSGSRKSPALELGIEPLRRVDRRLEHASAQALREHERAVAEHEQRSLRGRRAGNKCEGSAEASPQAPPWRQAVVSDVTLQALAPALAANPRGLCVARDELGAWLGDLTRFRGDRGSDAAAWLELYRAGELKVDRIGRGRTRVRRAAVSIVGTIQPAVLERIGREHVEDGMLARFLLAAPLTTPQTWTDDGIDAETCEGVERIYDQLAALEHEARPSPDDEANARELEPRELTLSTAAQAAWAAWYDAHALVQAQSDGALSYALAKLEELAARLALVLQLAADPDAREVREEWMRAGVEFAQWHAEEAERLYSSWEATPAERADQELLAWIGRQKEARATPRDLVRGPRRYRRPGGSEGAARDLARLAAAGWLYAEHVAGTRGGRPTVCYSLAQGGDGGDGDGTHPAGSPGFGRNAHSQGAAPATEPATKPKGVGSVAVSPRRRVPGADEVSRADRLRALDQAVEDAGSEGSEE